MSLDLCNEVGNPKIFYFVYPAESATAGYLDINDAVKRDNGRTPVCMLYLTHMLGQERAVDMMTNKKLRERHLLVLKIPNYEGKGFDAVVLRYSDVPLMNNSVEPLSTLVAIVVAFMFALSGFYGISGFYVFSHCKKIESAEEKLRCHNLAKQRLLKGAIIFLFPAYIFFKQLKAHRNERNRSRELESNLMAFNVRKWKDNEPRPIEAPEVPKAPTVAAGRLVGNTHHLVKGSEHKASQSRQSRQSRQSHRSRQSRNFKHDTRMHRRTENEFKRLQSQSLEATVAGAAAPRTYRTR